MIEALGAVRRNELTVTQSIRAALQRIESLDDELGAFVRLNPQAGEQAAEIDSRRERGAKLPLAGLPLAVKDNISTVGLETSCGSRLLAGYRPATDATAVSRLRDAGAVVVGKTNLDEFGMGSSTENSAFGPTRNPWDRERVAGGSSGGSAAAVAARMVPAALGSDTGGSVRQPAAFCGVVGVKPTYGRISRSGLVAFGSSLDQIGPITTRVSDAAYLLRFLIGRDDADMTSIDGPDEDLTQACVRGVEGMRIGVPVEYTAEGVDAEVLGALRAACAHLEEQGAVVEKVSLPHTRFALPAYYVVATAEASSNLARFDGARYGNRVAAPTLERMYRETRGSGFGVEVQRRVLLGTFALSAGYHDAYYERAQRVRRRIRADFVNVFERGIDALLTPTCPTTAFRLGEKRHDPLAMYLSDVFTVTANLAGIPALALPFGVSDRGLPLSLQLLAADFRESDLLRTAAVLEQARPPQAPPGATT